MSEQNTTREYELPDLVVGTERYRVTVDSKGVFHAYERGYSAHANSLEGLEQVVRAGHRGVA